MNSDNLIDQIQDLDEKLAQSIEHQKREAVFAEEANTRFERNLESFQKYYPDIAKAVSEYSVRPDFCLHVTKSGHGNFVTKGSSVPLYGDDPIAQTKEQVEKQTKKPFFSFTDYTAYSGDERDSRIHIKYMNALSKLMREIKGHDNEVIKVLPKHFPSAIIFGVGLGYHIPLLLEKTSFDYVFIVEPDFEQFFASLFCIDWATIIEEVDEQGRCLFINLGADKSSFTRDLEVIAEDIGAFSLVRSFCYQHTPQAEINQLITKWCNDYFLFQYGHGFFNDAITGLAHSIHLVEKTAQFLSWSNSKVLDPETPIFVVGNGPSLDEAEAFIKANHQKAIVIAAGTAVASLYKKGIPVDFHVLVERPYSNYQIFGDIVPDNYYANINLLGLNTLYPDNVDRYKWAGIATKGNEAGTFLLDLISYQTQGKILPLLSYSNPVVANTALSFTLFFGFKQVYLFGVDNGKLPNGHHHSKDSIYRVNNEDENEKGYGSLSLDKKTLPGNFGGVVTTNELFTSAHHQLEKLIDKYNDHVFYNVGIGAKLEGAIATKIESLLPLERTIDKNEQIEAIKSHFTSLPSESVNEALLAFDRYNEICEHLISIANEHIDSRQKASEVLLRQARYLFAFKKTALGHLYHMIKGSMLYYFCPAITLLYTYKDDDKTVEYFLKVNELWILFLKDMQKEYPLNYMAKCDLGMEN
ncbi:FIG00786906: hypothetical protein [Pseudoalteromonas luteoviolacea B = ATCC 29581]|nr:FIG00786906: hypothetical protein [Pseudoalteromonas luteoviolacea B = ATCC 29581]